MQEEASWSSYYYIRDSSTLDSTYLNCLRSNTMRSMSICMVVSQQTQIISDPLPCDGSLSLAHAGPSWRDPVLPMHSSDPPLVHLHDTVKRIKLVNGFAKNHIDQCRKNVLPKSCIYIIECSMPPLSEEATFQFSSPTQFQQTERKKKHIDLPLAAWRVWRWDFGMKETIRSIGKLGKIW